MCGIIGYTGTQQAVPFITRGLLCLKYRGYDSAGVALIENGAIRRFRVSGKPEELADLMADTAVDSTVAIGHNRWATHGKPSVENAHPHTSTNGRVAVVHNGTVENHATLRTRLQSEGYIFTSETDTEVLPNLIERELKLSPSIKLEEAVKRALSHVEGAYGIAVLSADHQKEIVVAALHSPIVIGIAKHGLFVASDETALSGIADYMVHLRDFELATLSQDTPLQVSGDNEYVQIEKVSDVQANSALGVFKHLMQKEVHEQPDSIARTLAGRLDSVKGRVTLGGLLDVSQRLVVTRRIVIVACGTSYYAGLAGKQLIERYTDIPVEVEHASEFIYRDIVLGPQDTVIAISQSGETADTIRAVQRAQEYGALCLGITNRTGTKLPRHTDGGVFLQAGPEQAVASTKSFTSQIVALAMIAIKLAMNRHDGRKQEAVRLTMELGRVPSLMRKVLENEELIQKIAREYYQAQRVIFIGRRFGYPIAMEGALKLKEIAYIDAHGFPAGELKHGPLALIEKGTPVIAIAREGELLDKMVSNIEEVRARGGIIIAITTEGNRSVDNIANHIIPLPKALEDLTPIIAAPVLQLFAYHMGILRGVDVDTPRNLAKAVSVE